MADIEKVIRGLEICTNPQTKQGCLNGECPYDSNGCRNQMEWDALELLKAQPKIVRCKDCKHGYQDEASISLGTVRCSKLNCFKLEDWFCGDAIRRSTDD